MSVDRKFPWELVIFAGRDAERVVSRWATFDDAYCAKCEGYVPEEWDELDIDIMKNGSTEY